MTPSDIEALLKEADAAAAVDRGGTHWDGCWTLHLRCMIHALARELRECAEDGLLIDRLFDEADFDFITKRPGFIVVTMPRELYNAVLNGKAARSARKGSADEQVADAVIDAARREGRE